MSNPESTQVKGLAESAAEDTDPQETLEWIEALDAVFEREGIERAHHLLGRLVRRARRKGAHLPYRATTAYINTIPERLQQRSTGDSALEERIRSFIRWNAMAMVGQGQSQADSSLGGHIATFAVGGQSLRGRVQPLLSRADRPSTAATSW